MQEISHRSHQKIIGGNHCVILKGPMVSSCVPGHSWSHLAMWVVPSGLVTWTGLGALRPLPIASATVSTSPMCPVLLDKIGTPAFRVHRTSGPIWQADVYTLFSCTLVGFFARQEHLLVLQRSCSMLETENLQTLGLLSVGFEWPVTAILQRTSLCRV